MLTLPSLFTITDTPGSAIPKLACQTEHVATEQTKCNFPKVFLR